MRRSLMRRLFGLVVALVTGQALVAMAQENTAGLSWGLGGLLIGVSALLIAVGALFVFIRLAKLLEGLEEYFKRK
jgi:hypothetical protein